ncbi:MAG: hypothetical protein QOF78_1109 [Phycisphaerales bacterium]|jgi:FkbM family methyltransferase|nr:hypothetical protein [Phycisphaerales bacterium]
MKSIRTFLPSPVIVEVVDIGANPIDGHPPYQRLLHAGGARVVGFEPNPQALAQLQQQKGPHETYLPDAIGDGGEQTLHLCAAAGMTSILKPNAELLEYFHGFAGWGRVVGTMQVRTRRLDDIEAIGDVDLLKLDVQGYELEILRHATKRLADAVVVHAETNFLPMYQGQPLFAEVEQYLRAHGLLFHRFAPLVSRVLQPMLVNDDVYAGLSQVFWADAVFVRDFTRFDLLPPAKLLKLATILHDVYGSYDVALHALAAHDRVTGNDPAKGLAAGYWTWVARELASAPQ